MKLEISSITDPFSLAGLANNYLDRLFLEKKALEKKSLGEHIEALKEMREQMLHLGFETPSKGMEELYSALKNIRKEYSEESAAAKRQNVLQGLKKLKYEAHIKRVTLDRVRTALRANQLALKRLEEKEKGSKAFDSELAKHLPLGGEWAVKLEKLDVHAREAYYQVLEELEREEGQKEVTVEIEIAVEGNKVRRLETIPIESKVLEYLDGKYGLKNYEVLNVRFESEKTGVLKDKYSRVCLAIAAVERIAQKAKEKSTTELLGKVDFGSLASYEKLLRKYNLNPGNEVLEVGAFEKLKEDLVKHGFMSEDSEVVSKNVAEQAFLKRSVFVKNYSLSAKALLAKELFLYYLLKGESQRAGATIMAGATQNPSREDLEALHFLGEEFGDFVKIAGFEPVPEARNIVLEKLALEKESDIGDPFLGAVVAYKHLDFGPEKVSALLGISLEEFKLNASKTEKVRLPESKLSAIKTVESAKAEKFLKALKGKKV